MGNDSQLEHRNSSVAPNVGPAGHGDGFLIMIDKLVETALLLSACISTADASRIDRCEALAAEVHEQEKALTRELLASKAGDVPKGLIHLPFLLQRVAEKLLNISTCFRLSTRDGILFNGKAEAHLDQLLVILVDMMSNLRDAFMISDAVLVESIISEASELSRKIRDFRSAHWSRPRTGASAGQATGMYLDILDAIKSASEDVGNICRALLELDTIRICSPKVPEGADRGR
jgi:Na+/phosphate symporter